MVTVMLDAKTCFQARTSRDSRFDGKFFTAVLTTGIFCRPICPARAAKEENVRYFENSQQALESGFKPCKRCLPEHAPEQMYPVVLKRMADALVTSQESVAQIASYFELSERQFRRNFSDAFGIAPTQYRLHHHSLLARKLIQNTTLTMTEVCFAAGFTSLRQFNQTIKQTFSCTPSQLRKSKGKEQKSSGIDIKLHYRPPFDWQAMLSFFQHRQLQGVEVVTNESYQRTINVGQHKGWFKVTHLPSGHALNLHVVLDDYKHLNYIINKVRRLFDLDADMNLIHQQLSTDPVLASSIEKNKGVRLPGCWDLFEFSVRAILGQQVSVKAATTLAARIASRYGDSNTFSNTDLTLLFPTVEQLSDASFEDLGLTQARIQTLRTWVEYYQNNAETLTHYQDLSVLEKQLVALKGIGPWTVNYIAMRGLSDPNAFPASDLGIIKALTKEDKKPTTKQIIERASAWQPWRAYATLYLWLSNAKKS